MRDLFQRYVTYSISLLPSEEPSSRGQESTIDIFHKYPSGHSISRRLHLSLNTLTTPFSLHLTETDENKVTPFEGDINEMVGTTFKIGIKGLDSSLKQRKEAFLLPHLEVIQQATGKDPRKGKNGENGGEEGEEGEEVVLEDEEGGMSDSEDFDV